MLYIRMFLVMIVSLFTQRVMLQALGIVDYGVYQVVGGFVMMFSIVSSTLSASISRFITFCLGKGDLDELKRVFSTSLSIQFIISLICVLLLETIGLWFINTHLNISDERMSAANWVYQFSICSFVLGLINVPYNASIIAHEKMSAFAAISILETFAKLGIAYAVLLSGFDHLVLYALFLMILSLIVRCIYIFYCRYSFEECAYSWSIDKTLFQKMLGFSGWNFIGSSAGILRDQGVNVLLNIFCGPVVNAARGIANQVNLAVSSFVNSFMTAINPQITKSYANGENEDSFRLVLYGSRFSFFLILLIGIPLCIESKIILDLWLVKYPEYSISFTRLIIFYTLLLSLSFPLITLMLATGNIQRYQIIVGGIQLLNLPLCYIVLKVGLDVRMTYLIMILLEVVSLCARLLMLKSMVDFPLMRFTRDVIFRVMAVLTVALIPPLIIAYSVEESIIRLIIVTFTSFISTSVVVYFIGCRSNERRVVVKKIQSILHR